jgi:hypothetical protein
MKKKARKTVQGILVTGVMVPITDQAEQAELERRCRDAENVAAPARATSQKTRTRKGK